MISYRDMTFCPFWKDCKSAYMCHRPLTHEVNLKAKEFGLPVSVFASKPECWSLKVPEGTPNDSQEATTCH